jgi:hypothetical protein
MLSDLLSHPAILLLAALVVVLLVVWLRTRERRFAVLLGVAGVLLALFALWKTFGPESDAAQVKRKLHALAAGVRAKQIDQVAQHVSDQFSYQGLDKRAMTQHVGRFIQNEELTDIEIWKEEPVQFKSGPNGRVATIEFKAKPKSKDLPTELYFHVIATFVLDGDGQWRLQGFELFRQPGNQSVRIPQLPLQ